MATTALQCSCAARTPALASGASAAKEFRRTAVRISQTRPWSSHVSDRRVLMSSEYSDRLGGSAAAFGAVAYILAPQILKSMDNLRAAAKRATWFLEEDEGLEAYFLSDQQRTLNETIAQLNAAIDKVSAQLRAKESLSTSSGNNLELEPAA